MLYEVITPFLEKAEKEPFEALKYASVVQAIVGFKSWKGMNLKAFGGLIPTIENKKILGALFTSSFFVQRAPEGGAVISVFMGGTNRITSYNVCYTKLLRELRYRGGCFRQGNRSIHNSILFKKLLKTIVMTFPVTRLRRLRRNATIRDMVRETILTRHDLIMPLFVCPGTKVDNPISSMPGNSQLSVDLLVEKGKELFDKGVQSVLLFGIPETKDETGEVACQHNGIVQQAARALKKA